MSDLIYIQKHIFDIDCKRVYPLLGYSELFAIADEVTFGDADFITPKNHIEELIDIGDIFVTSNLAAAVSLAKDQAKLWKTISELESGEVAMPAVPTHVVYKD